MKMLPGGVTAPKGFQASGVHCGVKKGKGDGNQPPMSKMPEVLEGKKDLALILSERECTAAAVYTLNRVKAAPLYVTMDHLENGEAQGIVANSGNANACAPNSHEHAERMCELAAAATGLKAGDFVVASTGVIGQELNIAAIEQGLPQAAAQLSKDGSDAAANAIMTTDTVKKELAVSCMVGGKTVTIGAIAKGSGMIHPNMATMLCFVTTDCAITPAMLDKAIHQVADKTFNMISVDGDTSTNDTFAILANGAAGNQEITAEGADYDIFVQALEAVCRKLSKLMAGDGEGATKLLVCKVDGAADLPMAKTVAKSVICSTLFKAAMFGADANWGRVLCAIGYSGAPVDVEKIGVSFRSAAGQVDVCKNGAGIPFSEEEASEVLHEHDIEILIHLHMGEVSAEAYGCDLTYDYVKINADYRS